MHKLYSLKDNSQLAGLSSEQLFLEELKKVFWAEKHLLRVLKRAEKAASTPYLKACFRGHYTATKEHVEKVRESFTVLNKKPHARKCHEIDSLIDEVVGVIRATVKNSLSRDLGLIHLATKIEHQEIKKYNSLINLANELGSIGLVTLLDEILEEEREAEETFFAVMEDTQRDETFQTAQTPSAPNEEEILQAV